MIFALLSASIEVSQHDGFDAVQTTEDDVQRRCWVALTEHALGHGRDLIFFRARSQGEDR